MDSKTLANDMKEKGNEAFKVNDFKKAVDFYSKAIVACNLILYFLE